MAAMGSPDRSSTWWRAGDHDSDPADHSRQGSPGPTRAAPGVKPRGMVARHCYHRDPRRSLPGHRRGGRTMKSSALQIARLEIPDYARGDQELWTPALVREALVDAFRLLRRTAARVGPGGLKAAWPEYFEAGDYPPEVTKTSPYSSKMTVTRMEMILLGWKDRDGRDRPAWLAGPLLAVPEYREKLVQWVHSELRGENATELCLRKKWSYATFKRHRDRAAGMVAQ